MEVTLAINLFDIYHLFLSRRHTSYLTNFIDSRNIIFGIITIILTKTLRPRWPKYLYYLIKKLSSSLEILGIMAYLKLILKLILIKSSQLFKKTIGVP